ncbi:MULTISPECIES: site-2 protease family protein [unclassified Paenibacillus]|uniref:site-2 protease family protein n=1 Tax=unclassified Paenibacillus TaxID=185978 RepID=UPI001C0F6319|nr:MULTISPECIES: site-2 protease family protein [unclassified Paenibacillus]MBU5440443.1 site-2 protease family protein [Paenibacillus sp. MSJ-34]CAH0119635.1 hypothetical protein PAE9249_02140 [Paenibacillus sp. CECT 9249]
MEMLQQLVRFPLEHVPFIFLVLMVAFTVHEFSHAYFAYKFGDPTAKLLGRVTLNPRVHLDVLGTILLFVAGFGWAKPVPVNRDNFANPRLMGIVVSAAGPMSNLFVAFIGTMLYYILFRFHLAEWILSQNVRVYEAIDIFLGYLVNINILLFLFNLIPLPPLDGYRILEDLAPRGLRGKLQQLEKWSIFIFLIIVFIPPIQKVTLVPLFSLIQPIHVGFYRFFTTLFGT